MVAVGVEEDSWRSEVRGRRLEEWREVVGADGDKFFDEERVSREEFCARIVGKQIEVFVAQG